MQIILIHLRFYAIISFGKLLQINEYNERKIRINPEMRNWVDRYLPAIPKLSGDAICEFEAVVKIQRRALHLILLLMTVTQKYVLKSSLRKRDLVRQKDSKSKSGISHHQKYTDLYQPWLNKSTVVRNPDTVNDFFCNYQLLKMSLSETDRGQTGKYIMFSCIQVGIRNVPENLKISRRIMSWISQGF